MNKAELLREILRRDFGIEDDAGLVAAVKDFPELDLGIFCAPVDEDGEGICGHPGEDGGERLLAG